MFRKGSGKSNGNTTKKEKKSGNRHDTAFPEEHNHQQQQHGDSTAAPINPLQGRTAINEEEAKTLIYAAPTVDTLGTDEGSLLRLHRQQQNSAPRLQRLDAESSLFPSSRTSSAPAIGAIGNEAKKCGSKSKNVPRSPTKNLFPKIQQSARHQRRGTNEEEREFQLAEDLMTVTVRNVPIAERSAYDKKMPSYQVSRDQNVSSRKISPSWQHWQVLQKLTSQTHIRQLAFSPSVGPAADIFWSEEAEEQEQDDFGRRSPRYRRRDGRYRSINPVQATMSSLPKTPPLLSNKKHRLPMRSDVGFPNAIPQEIQQKQIEIQQETEWEEASPRLIVLVTSDDLGTAVQEQEHGDEMEECSDMPGKGHKRRRMGLPGMPWAGEDLIAAKERNSRHFCRRRNSDLSAMATVGMYSDRVAARRTSMLAPPLDATFSRTLGWRPRPFHDRPPGLQYSLVCPLTVDFAIGKIEPLLCSLTLYSLEKGKISEAFYFPAGNWKGKIKLDSLKADPEYAGIAKTIWQHRKHKALFAHNPLATGRDDDDLHVVLEVFKVTHMDGAAAYWAGSSATQKVESDNLHLSDEKASRDLSRKISKREQTRNSDENDDELANGMSQRRSKAVFEACGMQFMSPLCFGITKLFPVGSNKLSRSNIWPKGQVQQDVSLYAFPTKAECQERFLHRLRQVAGNTPKTIPMVQSCEEDASLSSESLTPPNRRKIGLKGLLNPRKSSKKNGLSKYEKLEHPSSADKLPAIPGSATLFTSFLGTDFLQAMLATPPELIDMVSSKLPSKVESAPDDRNDNEVTLPRVLVDPSGDSAIMMHPSREASAGNTTNPARRSDLIRLPAKKPAGNLDSSEFREVLFLPPKNEKNYDCDFVQGDQRSLLNVVYFYPRRLTISNTVEELFGSERVANLKSGEQKQRYTIRIRLIQNLSSTNDYGIVESSNTEAANFFNPAPWGGPNLLTSVFTQISADDSPSHTKNANVAENSRDEIQFRDEFKMNLPTTLDGSYFLQFTLYSVDLCVSPKESISANALGTSKSVGIRDKECGVSLRQIGENSIPLSSSSVRDPKSGAKATTVIPNGCHRLRLGNCQFQIESRTVSSIHVSDPAIAAALRDFPSADTILNSAGNKKHELEEMVLVTSRSVVSRPVSSSVQAETSADKVSYSTLFGTASGSSVAAHFQPLLFLHFSNLVRSSSLYEEENIARRFIQENFLSLLVLVARVKAFFTGETTPTGNEMLSHFLKTFIDSFDEKMFCATDQLFDTDDDSASEAIDESLRPGREGMGDAKEDSLYDGGAIRRRKRHSIASNIDLRISKTFSTLETAEIPFSRKAYGATKADRMKLKAELVSESERIEFATFFDDDETVATFATTTRQAEAQLSMARREFEKKSTVSNLDAPSEELSPSHNSVAKSQDHHQGLDLSSYQRTLSELALGQRMKSAAQIMLAPCVTPALSNALLCRDNPGTESLDHSEKGIEIRKRANIKKSENFPDEADTVEKIVPGSDFGDGDTFQDSSGDFHSAVDGGYRGPWSCISFELSTPHDQSNGTKFPIARGAYLYESIIISWLHSWMDYVRRAGRISVDELFKDGNDPYDGLLSHSKFYMQMNFLLPLILKSVALRYSQRTILLKKPSARVVLDTAHVAIFDSFTEMLAIGLMGQACAEIAEVGDFFTLNGALSNCNVVLDFLIGLFALLHPAHMAGLLRTFLKTLRACESESHKSNKSNFEWNKRQIRRSKSSRQLRLRVIEKLSVMNNFVALNFPPRLGEPVHSSSTNKSTWTTQYGIDSPSDNDFESECTDIISADGLLPKRGWLASLLTNECLSICAQSCEAVVAEAMAHIESQEVSTRDLSKRDLKQRPTASLSRDDLLMFQSIAIHAITCVYELLLRRHAMDRRYQKESTRGRIAALFLQPVFDKSLASVRWLARMESTHKVRSIWLLCVVYLLQEAPESLVRKSMRLYSNPSDGRIHRLIRLLRLGSSTFQSFIDQERHCMFPQEIDKSVSPWLLQESFNTLCASTILVVEESVQNTSVVPKEQTKMIQGILDLLLHVLTTPQSSVTHLRAVGGAIQALEKFGTQMFLKTTGDHLQHWVRVILGLMNSTALSVRSIAVDFVVSLLGGVFELTGNIDDVALVFATVLPEVAAREIALCTVGGLLQSSEDAERTLWPLRRALADVEEASPLDDDRVDPQLSPVLRFFCRALQAIIDGVLIEMRLKGEKCIVAGTVLKPQNREKYVFDADEESVFEAANFFASEVAPFQRLRWLVSLKALHESKRQWVEAGECLVSAAKTISAAIPFLDSIWRPSRFSLWHDDRRSLWLSTVGRDMGNPEQGNAQVMLFAGSFLEPDWLMSPGETRGAMTKLPRPCLRTMCSLACSLVEKAVSMYARDEGMNELSYMRLESLQRVFMDVICNFSGQSFSDPKYSRPAAILKRKKHFEDLAILRQVTASITVNLTKVTNDQLMGLKDEMPNGRIEDSRPCYVRLRLSGKKPIRFVESTTLPTFLEWDTECICRVSQEIVRQARAAKHKDCDDLEVTICTAFCKMIRDALLSDCDANLVIFRIGAKKEIGKHHPDNATVVEIGFVHPTCALDHVYESEVVETACLEYRHFRAVKACCIDESSLQTSVEMMVPNVFPCPISRQQSFVTKTNMVAK